MSTLEVNTINPQSGSTITLGSSGNTVALGSGVSGSGFGKIGQIVEATRTAEFQTNSQSFVDSGFDVTITPTSTSSKVLVMLDIGCVFASTSGNGNVCTIYRNDTTDLNGGVDLGHFSRVDAANLFVPIYMQKLDSPSSTSAVKYTLYTRSRGGTQVFAPYGTSFSSFIAMEVLA